MNRKSIFSLVVTVSILILAACAPAAPTTAPVDNSDNTGIATTVISTDSNVTPVDSSNNNDTVGTSALACSGGSASASVTPELTEGPYYKAGSPEQANLYQDGMPGTKLVLIGYVYDINCQPVANAWLDFWQADANGNYDNSGY